MKITIIIPVYNEINSIEILLNNVLRVDVNKQIIVVDDCSTDGTKEKILEEFQDKIDKLILHEKNYGKGAAIISAQKYINGNSRCRFIIWSKSIFRIYRRNKKK